MWPALLCVRPIKAQLPLHLRPLPAATSNAHNAATCLACARTWFPSEQPFFHSPLGEWKKVRSLQPPTWYHVPRALGATTRVHRLSEAKEICAYAVLRVVPAWYCARIGRCALTCEQCVSWMWPEVAANAGFCWALPRAAYLIWKFIPARVAVGANFWAKGPKMRAYPRFLGV